MTQLSSIGAVGGRDAAHFGHPFALDLQFDVNRFVFLPNACHLGD